MGKGSYHSGRFLQRTRDFFTTQQGLADNRVHSVAFDSAGQLYAATAAGLAVFDGKRFCAVPLAGAGAVTGLACDAKGTLWAASGSTVYPIKNGKQGRACPVGSAALDFAQDGETLYLLCESMVYRLEGNAWKEAQPVEGARRLAVFEGCMYTITERNLLALDGKRPSWKGVLPAFTGIPDCELFDLDFDSFGHLWLSTAQGAYVYDSRSYWFGPDRAPNLPAECIFQSVADANGNRYFASDNGVICLANGELKYLGARRWVPTAKVNCVAVSRDGSTVWAATDAGLSRISSTQMTLQEKADHHQKLVEQYHVRDIGFVTVRKDIQNEDIATGRVEISDNDGLWTANYVASQAYRYAVTGDADALQNARRSMQAMLYLTRVTGIPGFTARAIRREGEHGYGNGDHEWILAPDGSCEWKCETSSDEMTGHFFGFLAYFDLCADKKEKKEICDACCAIMDHILANEYTLVDHDGKRTTWAMWAPDMLNHNDRWIWEKGINSLELLAFLKTCYHMSGNEKYNTEAKSLIQNHHYALNVIDQKVQDAHVTHIDDNLGFLSFAVLLSLEKNPDLRAIYQMGLANHWRYERIERTPLWSFIYGALTGNCCDLEAAVQAMREMPLSLIRYTVKNSTRKNLVWDTEQAAWGEPAQLLEPLPFDERPLCKWDSNPFRADGGDSTSAEDGTMFLLPYWYARYHGLLKEAQE